MTDAARVTAALAGISGILVTPFDATDGVAPSRLEPIIARAAAAEVAALTVNGNTSEFYGLTMAEAERITEEVPALVARRAVTIAGVGRSVGEAASLAARARRAGADAVMIHQPPDPFRAPRGVVEYVRRVAGAADLPVILYLRDDAMGAAAIEALTAVPGIVGVKWATPNLMLLAEMIRRTAGRPLAWVCGLAEPWAPPMTALGARGFTSGLINLFPERSMAVLRALDRGDAAAAASDIAALQEFEYLRAEESAGANVSVVKAALALIGEDVGPARPPAAWPLAPAAAERLRDLLARWGMTPRAAA
ncbi:dihydrodipicolinate synthase family protein [Roseomonas sp. CCTCC AB2023176]|uniref:dihydrodipicolinate synthase family protein n=1 Tax=Roseomonas sp. CCTCC AB2023176 TaxID=3342640 RepID=UPI0035D80D98